MLSIHCRWFHSGIGKLLGNSRVRLCLHCALNLFICYRYIFGMHSIFYYISRSCVTLVSGTRHCLWSRTQPKVPMSIVYYVLLSKGVRVSMCDGICRCLFRFLVYVTYICCLYISITQSFWLFCVSIFSDSNNPLLVQPAEIPRLLTLFTSIYKTDFITAEISARMVPIAQQMLGSMSPEAQVQPMRFL